MALSSKIDGRWGPHGPGADMGRFEGLPARADPVNPLPTLSHVPPVEMAPFHGHLDKKKSISHRAVVRNALDPGLGKKVHGRTEWVLSHPTSS